ncbi:MAG: ATP-binding cassette domain-containing protein [Verrucomicrobia bacterium]|nr:ATP-binding cassette domain-containing protein [Verrucomicrobiota bacterium]
MPAETSLSLIAALDLRVRYNERVILDGATLAIRERARTGLVGRNGSGKSTFIKILAGLLQPDSGEIAARRGMVVGYISQDFTLDPERTAAQNIRDGAGHIDQLIQEFESLPHDSKRHEELEQRIQALDGWNVDQRLNTAMSKLGIDQPDRLAGTLSGGEKRRVAMCRAIVSRPDLLILDEPTNHLDPEAIEWVTEFLKEFPGAVVVVTHDRYFLDEVAEEIVELANGRFFTYEGGYTDYLLAKAERQAAEESVEHKRQMFLRRELDWVRRGPSARRTKSKSKLDHYFEVAAQEGPPVEEQMDLLIPPPPQIGNRVLDIVNLGMSLGDRVLFKGFTFSFENGQRIGVAGRNGLGKTTLLRCMVGELEPTEGTLKAGPLTRFNYVDQGRVQLRDDATVWEEVAGGADTVLFGSERMSARSYLKRFLFTDDRISTQVKYLSGGERSRLLLARILRGGGNFLILDEPTNDLDLPTLRVLEEALIAFPGVICVVSHDRTFLNRVCTGILAFEGDQQINYSVGTYDYYVEKRQRLAAQQPVPPVSGGSSMKSTPDKASGSRVRKLSFKETKELEGMEQQIHDAESEVQRIEALFVSPDFHRKHAQQTSQLIADLDEAKALVIRLYSRWEELEAINLNASKDRGGGGETPR